MANVTMSPAQYAQMLKPFFTQTLVFKSKGLDDAGAYQCIVCEETLDKGTDAVVSHAVRPYGSWAHVDCLTLVNVPALSDKTAHKKAVKAATERQATARSAEKAPEHVCSTVDTAAIEKKMEAEYESVLVQMMERVTAQAARIARLEEELAALRHPSIALTYSGPVPDQQTVNARMNDSALTPQEKTRRAQDKPGVVRCNQPTKAGAACQWNIGKSPCIHHKDLGLVARVMSDPANETTVDVIEAESAPEQPRKVRPTDGEFDVTFVELMNVGAVRLHHPEKMYNLDANGFYCAYLTDGQSLVTAFKTIAPGSTVRVHLTKEKITSVKVLIGNASEAASKAKRNAGRAA